MKFQNIRLGKIGDCISTNRRIKLRENRRNIKLFTNKHKVVPTFIHVSNDKGLKKFVNKQEELLGVQGILSEWKAKVLLFVQKRTHASFVVQTSSDSSLSVPLGDLDHLKILLAEKTTTIKL
jgi:hypothetical protein